MPSYDTIIVGAGHNGLICACYLAKAGRKVLVLERRSVPGGAVCTEEIIPGFRFDVGSSAHIMFRSTSIMEELDLAGAGLEYIEMDPWAYYPEPGGRRGIAFHRSIDATCESIAQFSKRDAEAYRAFTAKWGALNEGVWEVFQRPPTAGAIFGTLLRRTLFKPHERSLWSSIDTTRQLLSSYGQLIRETFESDELRAAMLWLAAQSGPAPDEIATADFAGWQAMLHKSGAWRAKGGSGSLATALVKRLESLGGEVLTDAAVERIGAGFVVETARGTFHAKKVVAACHVQATFLRLLDPSLTTPEFRKRVERIKVGNGFGMVVRNAVDELPRYHGETDTGPQPYHSSLQLLCPSGEYLRAAHVDYLRGEPPRKPAVLAMTFSAIDPTLAPAGKHTLFAWAQYHPFQLGNGERWEDIADREADKIWEVVCEYAPNMRGKQIGRLVQSPLDISERFAMPNANVMHVEMSFDQMFGFRPLPELSSYTTPVPGLFLTGASMHPGGGVFGASGRNTARVVLKSS